MAFQPAILLLIVVSFVLGVRWSVVGAQHLLVNVLRLPEAMPSFLTVLVYFGSFAAVGSAVNVLPHGDALAATSAALCLSLAFYLAFLCVAAIVLSAACRHWEASEALSSVSAVQPRLRRVREFQELRGAFISQHGLLAGFPFAAYLRSCVGLQLARLLAVDFSCWLIAAMLVAVSGLLIREGCPGEGGTSTALEWRVTLVLSGIGLIPALLLSALALACQRALGSTKGGGLLGSDRYWAPPIDPESPQGYGFGDARSTHWLSLEHWLAARRDNASTRTGSALRSSLVRGPDGTIHYLPPPTDVPGEVGARPSSPPGTTAASWRASSPGCGFDGGAAASERRGEGRSERQNSIQSAGGADAATRQQPLLRSRASSNALGQPPCCCCLPRCCVRCGVRLQLLWRRVAWAPTVYFASSTIGLHVLRLSLFGAATLTALVVLPTGAGAHEPCAASPFHLAVDLSAAAPLLLVMPLLAAAASALWLLPTLGIVAHVGLGCQQEVMQRLTHVRSTTAADSGDDSPPPRFGGR